MIQLAETSFSGVFVLDEKISIDSRGSFSKLFDESFFENYGKNLTIKQVNLSKNTFQGTIRGFHFQTGEQDEFKIVKCVQGAIFDVLLDARKDSKTYGQVLEFELTEENSRSLLVPPGVAHAYQTIKNNSFVHYLHTADYVPDQSRGYHPIDSDLNFHWPLEVSVISVQDTILPKFRREN